ncbi:MAG: hypothetical protein V1824_04270 [archaeon]
MNNTNLKDNAEKIEAKDNLETKLNADGTVAIEEDIDDDDEAEGTEDESIYPFPKATVVRLIRKQLDPHKQIKGIVKKEMNLWLGKMIEAVCKKMNSFEYSYVDYGMFKQAIETYENINTIELEKMRIIKNLEKIKADCDVLVNDVERKFHM